VSDIKGTIPNLLKKGDLGFVVVSDNLADKNNVLDKIIVDDGRLIDATTQKCVYIPLQSGDAGRKLTYGGFYIGRDLYGAFYNGNTIVGSRFSVYDPNGRTNPGTITIPSGCDRVYIDIYNQSTAPNEHPYDDLMVNYGETLLPYDEFEKQINEILDFKIFGSNAEQQELDLIVDLPVSDGTNIQSGYAYIDSTDRCVKVKE
jgi:hypothetical protein